MATKIKLCVFRLEIVEHNNVVVHVPISFNLCFEIAWAQKHILSLWVTMYWAVLLRDHLKGESYTYCHGYVTKDVIKSSILVSLFQYTDVNLWTKIIVSPENYRIQFLKMVILQWCLFIVLVYFSLWFHVSTCHIRCWFTKTYISITGPNPGILNQKNKLSKKMLKKIIMLKIV